VSIIIPNRDQPELLRRCIDSIDQSSYENYELLIVENESREPATHQLYAQLQKRPNVRIVPWQKPFNFAAANNHAVRSAAGEVLLFLNNDTEALHADWIERLVEHAIRPEVGAVGAKLFYPDGTLQHAGVIVGLCGNAAHMHHFYPGDDDGYFGRLSFVQNYSAVTGACLICRRDVFETVGGFDEQFELSYNDVDFCLRLRERGFLIVWTPEARLRHWESKTRGSDATPSNAARFARESALFRERWADLLARGDPYYSPHLILSATSCSVRA
jgi:GT2 family glycosyltransferase